MHTCYRRLHLQHLQFNRHLSCSLRISKVMLKLCVLFIDATGPYPTHRVTGIAFITRVFDAIRVPEYPGTR